MSPRSSDPDFENKLTRQEMCRLIELLQKCTSCTTREDMDEVVEGLKSFFPFEFFTCLYTRTEDEGIGEPHQIISTNYPSEWVKVYLERNYHLIDPIIRESFTSFGLQYWADTYGKYGPPKDFVSAAEDFGLRSGYTSSVVNLAGNRCGLFSFSGRSLARSERTGSLLKLVTPHLYQALERIVCASKLKQLPPLSSREKEVLRWITLGKTTWETSAILGISERTVKFHVNNIMKKLNASTRTHAVAILSELGLMNVE